jgi:hypothetical protein
MNPVTHRRTQTRAALCLSGCASERQCAPRSLFKKATPRRRRYTAHSSRFEAGTFQRAPASPQRTFHNPSVQRAGICVPRWQRRRSAHSPLAGKVPLLWRFEVRLCSAKKRP